MAKYMFNASYTLDGLHGLMKDGGTGRRAAVQKTIEGIGGKLEAFYYTFGTDDLIFIVDLPNNVSAAAAALTFADAGGATVETTVLLTPEEIDAATKTSVDYRKPGG